MPAYQQKCIVCRKNMVLVQNRRQKPICGECWKRQNQVDMNQEIKDPEMKKMFDIDPELYKKSSFLRDIKKQYLVNDMLSEKQIAAFKKVVEEMSKEEPSE